MPEKWTGRLVGIMHNERITHADLAARLNVTQPYISMILNGVRKPPKIRQRMESAVSDIIKERKSREG